MGLTIVVGAQWGDEGKGRVVDLLAGEADIVARYSGGDNAGHTVAVGSQNFKLHLLPSGVVHSHTIGVLGNGMVINPGHLIEEMEKLRKAGLEINPQRVKISHAAHLITPGHLALDEARELARGEDQIGTTRRGIGPAYNSKAARSGLRMEAVFNLAEFEKAVRSAIELANEQFTRLYGMEALDAGAIARRYAEYGKELAPYVTDVGALTSRSLSAGSVVLAEGAQGTLLDLDHGTYPYVTSSTPTAPGALVGLGLGIGSAGKVVGVVKAFQTRVGEGPFPTELEGDLAGKLRGTGANDWDEFGTTTGRPRRVGWLDGVLLRYAVRINGLTELAVTKLDILSGLEEINLCTSYIQNGQQLETLPLGPTHLNSAQPVYETLEGWDEDLTGLRLWQDLPAAARRYIERVEMLAGIPARMISVGPERSQIIIR